MTRRDSDSPLPDLGATRRQFFKFLAASPLAALAYAAVPSSWLEPLAAAGPPRDTSILPCASCGAPIFPPAYVEPTAVRELVPQEVPQQLPPQQAQEEQLTGSLIATPEEAINVWDFERVLHEYNLAQHWDYLHMGVDDYETRVANREGFLRLMLRPRRIPVGPERGLDTSVDILGQRFDTPLFLCPVGSLGAYHTQAEVGAARGAQRHGALQIQSNVSTQSYEEIA